MEIDGLQIEVVRKPVKTMRLSVSPPDGEVRITAPAFLSETEIRDFVLRKWEWIMKHRKKMSELPRQTGPEYVSGENHYLFGQRYILRVDYVSSSVYSLKARGNTLIMSVSEGTSREGRMKLMRHFYRKMLGECLTALMAKWSLKLREPLVEWEIRQMRTKWGSCTPDRRTIRFSLDLARVTMACVEYVVVHELTHLQVRNHGNAFEELMTQRLPEWRELKKELNAFPSL